MHAALDERRLHADAPEELDDVAIFGNVLGQGLRVTRLQGELHHLHVDHHIRLCTGGQLGRRLRRRRGSRAAARGVLREATLVGFAHQLRPLVSDLVRGGEQGTIRGGGAQHAVHDGVQPGLRRLTQPVYEPTTHHLEHLVDLGLGHTPAVPGSPGASLVEQLAVPLMACREEDDAARDARDLRFVKLGETRVARAQQHVRLEVANVLDVAVEDRLVVRAGKLLDEFQMPAAQHLGHIRPQEGLERRPRLEQPRALCRSELDGALGHVRLHRLVCPRVAVEDHLHVIVHAARETRHEEDDGRRGRLERASIEVDGLLHQARDRAEQRIG